MARMNGFTHPLAPRSAWRPRLHVALSLSTALMAVALALSIGVLRLPLGPVRKPAGHTVAAPAPDSTVAARNRSTHIDRTLATVNGFITRGYTDTAGATMMYYLHVPPGVNDVNGVMSAATRFPVVLLLHGGGERANPKASLAVNRAHTLNTPYIKLWTAATVQAKYPCFVITPQVVGAQTQWVNTPVHQGSYVLADHPSTTLRLANDILRQVMSDYHNVVDPQRVYITGISMGGYGVWDAIERWPQEFAAAAPLSGAGDPGLASRVVHLPLWVFHGAKDTIIPVSGSRDMIAAITALGGTPRYTEFPNANHEIWVPVYSDPDFLAWLFAQRSSAATWSAGA